MDSVEDLIPRLQEQGYKNLRVLADGTIVGTVDLLYTRAVVIDLDACGYAHRFCYPDRTMAVTAVNALKSGDERPMDGYIAERHR